MQKSVLLILIILVIPSINWAYANLNSKTPSEDLASFPGWNRKQPITIQASQVVGSANLTDFPVLITLDQLNSEIADGGEINTLLLEKIEELTLNVFELRLMN
ncbi:MAG: hypothetical protein AAF969_07435 [Bacteroidota bacterium]